MSRPLVMCAAIVMLAPGAARAQDVSGSDRTAGAVSLAEAAAHARFDFDRVEAPQPDCADETHIWNNIRRGFYAGLLVGGLVGVFAAADCGHPECGPLIPFFAGLGGSIGLGIDALIDQDDHRTGIVTRSAHAGTRRPASSAGRRVMMRLRKSW